MHAEPVPTPDPLLIPRPSRRERAKHAALLARLQASTTAVRRGRVDAARARLAAGDLDTPAVFRAVARRLLGE